MRTLAKNQKAVYTKIAGQMCCKLGGALWAVHNSVKDMMVVGFDLWKEKNTLPVAAMVTSLDQHMTSFFSVAYPQQTSEVVATNFSDGFRREN